MDLWPSKKEQNVVRCLVSKSKRRWTCFIDRANTISQTCTLPLSVLISSRFPSADHADLVGSPSGKSHVIIISPEMASIRLDLGWLGHASRSCCGENAARLAYPISHGGSIPDFLTWDPVLRSQNST